MPPLFGTDGVRGLANAELTPELVVALGRAAATVLGDGPWLVARDTRRSGPMLSAALASGLASSGARVLDLGVMPTPALALVGARRRLPAAMVSASHNPFADNGVKLFGAGGVKLAAGVEGSIEAAVAAPAPPAVGAEVGTVEPDATGLDAYRDHLAGVLGGRDLGGLRMVVDCANGAASGVAGAVFRRAGAEPTLLHAQPDGTNINHGCGSTHPEALQEAVVASGAPLGLALDGDADRVLAVDASGALVDGDAILAMLATDLRRRGLLARDTVVVTVMSNLGLRLSLEAAGIGVVETQVGDRHVLEAMAEGGYSLGGEQSGHVVMNDLATTGDGLLTGLVLADLVARSGRPLAELAAEAMTRLPQVLHNVRVADRSGLAGAGALWEEVRRVESALGRRGRVLLRASGTEPVVRVMVEAPEEEVARQAASHLAEAVAEALGAGHPRRP